MALLKAQVPWGLPQKCVWCRENRAKGSAWASPPLCVQGELCPNISIPVPNRTPGLLHTTLGPPAEPDTALGLLEAAECTWWAEICSCLLQVSSWNRWLPAGAALRAQGRVSWWPQRCLDTLATLGSSLQRCWAKALTWCLSSPNIGMFPHELLSANPRAVKRRRSRDCVVLGCHGNVISCRAILLKMSLVEERMGWERMDVKGEEVSRPVASPQLGCWSQVLQLQCESRGSEHSVYYSVHVGEKAAQTPGAVKGLYNSFPPPSLWKILWSILG